MVDAGKPRSLEHRYWMSVPEEDRFLACAALFEAERLLSERQAPQGIKE